MNSCKNIEPRSYRRVRLPVQPTQKVIHIYVAVHLCEIVKRDPAHIVDFTRVINLRRQLFFYLIEVILAN